MTTHKFEILFNDWDNQNDEKQYIFQAYWYEAENTELMTILSFIKLETI